MLLEPCPSYLRKRPHYLDRWVLATTSHTVPAGFSEAVLRLSAVNGVNWCFLAAYACLMTEYFGKEIKGNDYFRFGPADSLDAAIQKAIDQGKLEPMKIDSIKTRQAYKAFIVFAAQELGRESGVKLPDVPPVGSPVKPSPTKPDVPDAPEPIDAPEAPKTPDIGWKAPWYLKLFKGAIYTALMGGIAWLVTTVPFLLPFKTFIIGIVTAFFNSIFG